MTFLRCTLPLFLAVSLQAAEPAFEWVAAGGGVKNDKTRAVNVDAEGNVFLAGETTGEGSFGELKREALGTSDFFLAKVSPEGKFLWVRSLGGSLVDRGYGVVTDPTGNAYVTGHYQSTDAKALGQVLPNAGDYDIFVAKYGPDGDLLWIRTAGGAGYDYGHGIALDSKGHIVVSGALVGESKFGDVVVNAGSKSRAVWWAKYDAQGSLMWVKTTSGKFSGSGHGIAVDGQDNIYVGGSGSGAGQAGQVALGSPTGQAAWVMKTAPDGEAVWASVIPGAPSAGFHEITVDAQGRVWGAGMFKEKLAFGIEVFATTGAKDSDGFLAHFSPEGKPQWCRVVQGPGVDYCLGVATDGTGRAFVTGEFSATALMAGQKLVSQGATDIYTAAFDSAGKLEWVYPNGGIKGDNAYSLVWRPGYLILGGATTGPSTFGEHPMNLSGAAEAHAAKFKLNSK
ncbi:SBBP repeat-containing protein [Prosthecobacter sp. SYSU 5D2]|uniref:SBBP repeat-containing protein n=1 Tax=Prosthecobacter sp. SYSU 5D2 TaxID=3134134 RepID=UPI0031FED3CF